MKKFITTSVAVAALLTNAQADFDFGDMFTDMKDAAISMSKDAKDSVTSMKDGAVETSKSAERTVSTVSSDAKDTSVKVSDDIKVMEVNTTKDFLRQHLIFHMMRKIHLNLQRQTLKTVVL